MSGRAAQGHSAETAALQWLQQRGLKPLARNYRCRFGELDLILRDGPTVAVVEVRSRVDASFVRPELSIDWRKQGKIVRSTESFLGQHPRLALCPVRFDVIAVTGTNHEQIEWIRNAFEPDDRI